MLLKLKPVTTIPYKNMLRLVYKIKYRRNFMKSLIADFVKFSGPNA